MPGKLICELSHERPTSNGKSTQGRLVRKWAGPLPAMPRSASSGQEQRTAPAFNVSWAVKQFDAGKPSRTNSLRNEAAGRVAGRNPLRRYAGTGDGCQRSVRLKQAAWGCMLEPDSFIQICTRRAHANRAKYTAVPEGVARLAPAGNQPRFRGPGKLITFRTSQPGRSWVRHGMLDTKNSSSGGVGIRENRKTRKNSIFMISPHMLLSVKCTKYEKLAESSMTRKRVFFLFSDQPEIVVLVNPVFLAYFHKTPSRF